MIKELSRHGYEIGPGAMYPLPRAAGVDGFAMIGKDHIFFLADARSENEWQRDEVFRRSSVKVADLAAFKVGTNQTFH